MPRSILITQCLQNDFIAPLEEQADVPNDLHIGAVESRRLLGDDPRFGPLGRFLKGCYYTEPAALGLVHLRDWHSPDDATQQAHLDFFGAHCLAGSVGAQFIPPLDELVAGPRASATVNCRILNDCEETNLPAVLAELRAGTPLDEVRVGVIGVWTDVKVAYLLYDLKTRLGFTQLAVCSALVASGHRRAHFEALEHVRQVLGVQVLDSVGEFLTWLGLGEQAALATLPAKEQPHPHLSFDGAPDAELQVPLNPYRRLVKRMFRHCQEVRLRALGGGFSGSRVFHTHSVDSNGYVEATCVLKMDRRAQIAQERANYERVENILGPNAPQVKEYLELGEYAGIKYMYASMGRRPVRTLKEAFADAAVNVGAVLDDLWSVLGRLYRHAHLERVQPYRLYGFRTSTAKRTVERWRELVGADSPRVVGRPIPNPEPFYAAVTDAPGPTCYAYHSYIHGDLNAANVLLDEAGNMWIIDFFHTSYGHVLQDLAKLENDLKFIATPVDTDDDLGLALEYEAFMAGLGSQLETPPALPAPLAQVPALVRLHVALSSLRRFAAEVALDHAALSPYHIAQLRYAAHSLTFDECNARQKLWAAASVGYLSSRLYRDLPFSASESSCRT